MDHAPLTKSKILSFKTIGRDTISVGFRTLCRDFGSVIMGIYAYFSPKIVFRVTGDCDLFCGIE